MVFFTVAILHRFYRIHNVFFVFYLDGDPDHHFHVGLEAGNLMVARQLDWETRSMYNLTVQVTDGLSYDNCTVSL